MSLRNRYVSLCFRMCFVKWYPQVWLEQTTPVSSPKSGTPSLRIRALSRQLVDTFVCLIEKAGMGEKDGEKNFVRKEILIKKYGDFSVERVTRRNTVEMDGCVHSKCQCNRYNFNRSVTVVFVPPPSSVYLRSRERRTHATQQLFYIRQDSSTCGKHAKSLLGNPMWERNRSHRRLSCTWHEREAITF